MNALWCLARIDTDAAREAVRLGLTSPWPGVRQVAARVAGLHRDAKALPHLAELAISDAAPVRREAATALGRIRKAEAVPVLLKSLAKPEDRFLEHALIFALIQISDREATLKGLQAKESSVHRGALIALDQMDGGNLTPDWVVPLLKSSDSVLRETAFWITAHRPDWVAEISGFLREELANKTLTESQRSDLKKQLLTFAKNQSVQELMAETLRDPATPKPTCLMLLEAMAGAPITKVPLIWADVLERTIAKSDDAVIRQSVMTVRSVPTGRRPALKRIDAQINFPETTGPFAGTPLSEKFAVRWTGLIKVAQAGRYSFYAESNDGSRLLIGGELVVDNGGSHAMAGKRGERELAAGEHEIRLDYFQNTGGAGCILSWQLDGLKEPIPATAFFHRSSSSAGQIEPGLVGDYFEIGREVSDFPDTQYVDFKPALLRVARDANKPEELRIQALAGISDAVEDMDTGFLDFLLAELAPNKPPLYRVTAATALGRSKLRAEQLQLLTDVLPQASPLELPKLLTAYTEACDEALGRKVLHALHQSKGLISLKPDQLKGCLAKFPNPIQAELEPLLRQLDVDAEKQKARLAELETTLRGGDRLRGSHIFNGPKAACTTCHRVGYLGGQVGPDLGRIGSIRSERDLLEAIVFPSASFARGYETMMVTVRDGETYSGVIARETPETITLVLGANNEMRLARADIKDIRPGTLSLMPQGLDQQLSQKELGDLLAFLKSLK